MGRGIALYDNSIMFHPAFFDLVVPFEIEEEMAREDLQSFIASAINGHVDDEWIRLPGCSSYSLHSIAENDKFRVCLEYEDTYWQIVVLPKTYSRWLLESKAENEPEHTGYNYVNSHGQYVIETLREYSIARDARRLFRKLVIHFGYKRFYVRTSSWTSGQVRPDSFKEQFLKKAS